MLVRLVVAALRNSVLLLFVLFTPQAALASEAIRCGTDDFGNTVCMDKEGVLTSVSPQAGSSVPSTGSTSDSRQDDRRVRCGVDPFGNRVCR